MAEQEAMVGNKTTEDVPKDKIGEMTAQPPSDEVGGRAMVVRYARCGACGATGYINYDTVNYRAYQCNNCRSIIIF